MQLQNIIISTGIATAGMTIRDVFDECIRCHVPRIPFAEADGTISGCLSIRHVIHRLCIPDYVVEYADLLGDSLGCLKFPEQHARQVMNLPAERFVLRDYGVIDSQAPIARAVAVMEKHDTNYVFVIDDGEYRGIVTVEGIARRMLEVAAT